AVEDADEATGQLQVDQRVHGGLNRAGPAASAQVIGPRFPGERGVAAHLTELDARRRVSCLLRNAHAHLAYQARPHGRIGHAPCKGLGAISQHPRREHEVGVGAVGGVGV
ncbi:MAG: hypothetical protein ACK55I_09435, partial [bacterium]